MKTMFVVIALIALVVSGCQLFNSSKLPSDAQNAFSCAYDQVVGGNTDVKSVVKACSKFEESMIFDAIALLLDSTVFKQDHPSAAVAVSTSFKSYSAERSVK